MAEGALALVVGPSGAGKDTLIGRARDTLAADTRFVFPRRIVTREAVTALEDHDTVEPEQFQKQKLRGDYALDWQAHGLHYALPASIDTAMIAGRVVVANVSRAVISRALEKYQHCQIILVTARPEVRAARLGARGRETEAEIAARLAREGAEVPAGVLPIVIDNSGALDVSLRGFLGALDRISK